MKRNITLTLLFCLLGAFVLAGCTPAENTGNATNAPAAPSTNAPPK